MAAFKTIMSEFRAELDGNLRAMTLGMFVTDYFRMRGEDERCSQPIISEEAGGTPRLWQLSDPTSSERITIGHASSRRWAFRFNIEILYPGNDADWRLAVWDDADRIMQYLQDNATSTSGIDFREPDSTGAVEIEPIEENNWIVARIPLFAVFEVST